MQGPIPLVGLAKFNNYFINISLSFQTEISAGVPSKATAKTTTTEISTADHFYTVECDNRYGKAVNN